MRKFLLIGALLSVCLLSHAQRRLSIPFGSAYDEDAPIVLGINYAYINSKYIVSLQEDALNGSIFSSGHSDHIQRLQSINSSSSHGVSVGIPIDFRITDLWYASFHPNFTFINHTGITYSGEDGSGNPQELIRRQRHEASSSDGTNFNSFEFPIRLRLRSEEKYFLHRENRYRGYITAGAKLTRWIGITEEYSKMKSIHPTNWTNALIMKPEYGSWEVGVGAEIFFTYFKLSPEIRFSQSFGSVLDQNNDLSRYVPSTGEGNPFMGKLDRVLARGIYFSLIFQ